MKLVQLFLIVPLLSVAFVGPVCADSDPNWLSVNRFVGVRGVLYHESYKELDSYGLTSDGVLDSETGTIPAGSITFGWQGTLASLPVLLRTRYLWGEGQTSYRGYLQTGSGLSRYLAKTGNTTQIWHINVGMPLNYYREKIQITPMIGYTGINWSRDLVDYTERIHFRGYQAALLVQWLCAHHWWAGMGFAFSHLSDNAISISRLNFHADIPTARQWKITFELHHRLVQNLWVGVGGYWARRKTHATQVSNGLQLPPAGMTRIAGFLQLSWHY